jgi:hypothetical protein
MSVSNLTNGCKKATVELTEIQLRQTVIALDRRITFLLSALADRFTAPQLIDIMRAEHDATYAARAAVHAALQIVREA